MRVTPRAGIDRIDGVVDGALRLRVRAAPADGEANEALLRLIAEALEVPRSSVSIVGGTTSRTKLVAVDDAARQRIQLLWPALVT